MKVVINKCYGGFTLSNAAVERCVELGMTLTESVNGNPKDPNAHFVHFKDRSIFKDQHYYARRDHANEFRCDPRVVQAVEELGDAANGPCSELKVIEIPFDGPSGWEVDEYDGMESIVPNHARWG